MIEQWRATAGALLQQAYVAMADVIDRWCEELPSRRRLDPGRRGERTARRRLQRQGYIILAQNYRTAGAEIDLIALDGATLAFIEVKARANAAAGTPREAVDYHKQQQLRRAAEAFVASRRLPALQARFDIVAILGAGRHRRIELIKDSF